MQPRTGRRFASRVIRRGPAPRMRPCSRRSYPVARQFAAVAHSERSCRKKADRAAVQPVKGARAMTKDRRTLGPLSEIAREVEAVGAAGVFCFDTHHPRRTRCAFGQRLPSHDGVDLRRGRLKTAMFFAERRVADGSALAQARPCRSLHRALAGLFAGNCALVHAADDPGLPDGGSIVTRGRNRRAPMIDRGCSAGALA